MVKDSGEASPQMDRDMRNAIILLLFVGLSTLVVYFLTRNIVDSWLGLDTISPDRIGMASVLVMQIDSFLVAGYVIGLFQFQHSLSGMIQVMARLGEKELLSWKDSKGTKYFESIRFFMGMLVIVLFVGSALYAVRSTLFETRTELVASLSLLVQGAALMVAFLGGMSSETKSMAERIGKALANQKLEQS